LPAIVLKDPSGIYKVGAEFKITSFKETARYRYWTPGMEFLLIYRNGVSRHIKILPSGQAMDVDTGERLANNRTLKFEHITQEGQDE
jgi:hypothetical protein